jgi:PAS domain S-box-containing protein
LTFDVIYQNEAAVQLCSENSIGDLDGCFTELVSVRWERGENLEKIASRLSLGKVWKSERSIQIGKADHLPYEISIKAIHVEGREKIGYSIILRGLEEKYKAEQVAKSAQLIVENSPAVLFRVDPNENFKIHYISENIRRFGYEAAFLIQNQVSFLDLLHPSDAEMVINKSRKSKNAEGVPAFSGEYRIKTTTGEFVWIEDRTRDVVTDSGKIVLHEGLFQDISDRKYLEVIQSQRDKQYRVLAANIPDTNIFLIDADRTYILAEGTNFEKWGLTREDFEGRKLKDVQLTPYEEINGIIERVFNQLEIVDTEFVLKGRRYSRSIRPIVIEDEVKYAMSIVKDVHDEYQVNLDLQQSEEKYRRLVEESTEIIFSLAETFIVYYVSPNVIQFLGYDSMEITGRSIFDFLHPDDLDVFLIWLDESNDFLAKNQFLEYRLKHKNGEYRVFNSNGKLIEAKNGIHRYYTGIARDISKLKETQRELVLAKEKAEQASQVKSQFLSVMSHEIRTPMNAVIGLAHFLMEEDPRPDQLENLRTLQFSAESLMALINDILDYTKIDSGKVELEHEPFDLRNIIYRIVHAHSFPAHEKSLKITCQIDESIPETFVGDSLRIGQVVNNLVSNAIKFTESGFVRITVTREFIQTNHTDIRFVFEDTGIGIPESKRAAIFEAFTQASSSTSRMYGGTGLGLAIVKRLVELFGGDIEMRARRGGGSIFEFTIPLEFIDLQKIETEKAEQISNRRSLEKAAILVAEDNAVNQILIRKFLIKWNVGNLVIASDGQEALEQFNEGDFDLVLLDLQMPVLDGFGVARAIRNHPDKVKQRVPILALTAASLNEVKEELTLSGMDDFIPKPFTPEILFEKILKYLNPKDRGGNGV